MANGLAELSGTYRLVVSSELRAFIERAFVEPAAVDERERARTEALAEAESATLEIGIDGRLVSRALGRDLYTVTLPAPEGSHAAVTFEKAPGVEVRLCLRDARSLLVSQAGKPDLIFSRCD